MEENDKWINTLRDRMENYSESVPEDLWEQLERELDALHKVVPMEYRWQAVAAIALLVIVTSVSVWFLQSPSLESVQRQSAVLEQLLPIEVEEAAPVVSVTSEQKMASLLPLKRKEASSVVRQEKPQEEQVEQPSEVKKEIETPEQIEENYPEEQTVLSADTPAKQQGKGYSTQIFVSKKKKERNWSIGLSTGNGGGTSSIYTDGYLPLPPAVNGVYINQSGAGFTARSEKQSVNTYQVDVGQGRSKVNYRLPVSFGASLRFGLNRDWALETGLFYTKLSSETLSGDNLNRYQWEEALHYVGIPLKIHRNIWSTRHFEFYASAGGAVEKCVSGKQVMVQHTTEGRTPVETDLSVKSLQCSVSAAAGIQFKLTEKLGIYAEPGISYYFDDGSKVNTVRKEHPLNFHAQVGVRFTLSK